MQFAIVTHHAGETNTNLAARRVEGLDVRLVPPAQAVGLLEPGDVALARLDVRQTLDGIEDGLPTLSHLEENGINVLNPPGVLLSAHDKLLTARALERRLTELETRPWFRTHGALAQELIPPLGHDLRLVVAAGGVVGAIKRVAAPGEWRTNLALGGTRVPISPSPAATKLAEAAARSIGADLVGVDLLPTGPGRFSVIELNGAVDFGPEYSLGPDVFAATLGAFARHVRGDAKVRSQSFASGSLRLAGTNGSVARAESSAGQSRG